MSKNTYINFAVKKLYLYVKGGVNVITQEEMQQEYLTVDEAAQIRGVNSSRIRQICIEGKFEGAFKRGGAWFIPRKAVEIYKPQTPGPKPRNQDERDLLSHAIREANKRRKESTS